MPDIITPDSNSSQTTPPALVPPEAPLLQVHRPRWYQRKATKVIAWLLFGLLIAAAGVYNFILREDDKPNSSTNTQETINRSIEPANIGLYSVQAFDFNDQYSFYLNYPQLDEPHFDSAIASTVNSTKTAFLASLKNAPVPAKAEPTPDLNVAYQLNYYDDNFLSIDLVIYEFTPAKGSTQLEHTVLYDRKAKKVMGIQDLFKPGADYRTVLSQASRSALPAIIGKAANPDVINKGTDPKTQKFDEFTIDTKHNLIVIFEPGEVAPVAAGIIRVPIAGNSLATVFQQPLASQVFAVAERRPEPRSHATGTNNGPIPQADPKGVNCATAKCIALTFDDGPSYTTPQLLDTLKANNVKATFFELGIQAQKYPSVTQRVVAEGHVIGNHTFDHRDLANMPLSDAQGEISRAADIIEQAGGVRPGLVRAPYGDVTNALAQQLNAPFIMWNVDPDDWKDRDANIVHDRVMAAAKPGAIILSHDIYQSTVDAYTRIIPELISQGYILVTVPQLLGFGSNVQPAVYFSR